MCYCQERRFSSDVDPKAKMLSKYAHHFRRLAGGFALSTGAGIAYCSPTAPIRCNDGTTVIPWSAPTRESQIERLKNEIFDVVVIGGGCVGAGCAWEAATRGLKVALIERDDFAAGTSGYVDKTKTLAPSFNNQYLTDISLLPPPFSF